MQKLRALVMFVACLSLSTAGFAQNGGVGECMSQLASDMQSASFDYGACAIGALGSSGLLACWANQEPDCSEELTAFAMEEATCASTYIQAIFIAASAKDDCLSEARDIDIDELKIWIEVQDIDVFINIEGLIHEIEGMIARLTGRVIFEDFFGYLKKEDFKGATLYLKEVNGVDPATEFPDQWTAMVEAVESAGLAEYYGNFGDF